MLREVTTFKCTQCGAKFPAPDIEYMATAYSMPQKCPKCGSIRTRPVSLLGKLKDEEYRRIWERMEKESKSIEQNNL